MENGNIELNDILKTISEKIDSIIEKLKPFSNESVFGEQKSFEITNGINMLKNEEIKSLRRELKDFKLEITNRFVKIEEQLNLLNVDIEFLTSELAKNKREINRLKQA